MAIVDDQKKKPKPNAPQTNEM
jgi:hypothetical protein